MMSETVVRPSTSDSSFFSKSKATKNTGRSSATTTSDSSGATKPTVVTRVVTVRKPAEKSPATLPLPLLNPSTSQSRESTPGAIKKRKAEDTRGVARPAAKKSRVTPPTNDRLAGSSRSKTPVRTTKTRESSRARSSGTPEPVITAATSRSRSVTAVPNDGIRARECWITEDGTPGPNFKSCEHVVKGILKQYKTHFKNPANPDDKSFEANPIDYPTVELEYPNTNASESFILLTPRDKDHYDPILCLKQSLLTIVEHYLTPEQRSLFGTLPSNNLLIDDDDHPTRSSTPSNGDSQTFRLPRLACLETHPPSVNYLKTLQRAITKQDGPQFMRTMTSINAILRVLKYPPLPDDPLLPPGKNSLKECVKTWSSTGMPKDVSLRLIDETYQRCVGPQVHTLRNYEAFSSETYGELMPSLVSDIIRRTGLGEDSLFLDLGCGVGNVVLQASLQTGCRSFGIEIMATPAGLAREQLEQLKVRARMWGVNMGEVEFEEGDMLKSERVAKLMSEADVVLINNKVFKESLNECIRPKFLDLKEGAIVVSLKPFVPVNARLTERNVRGFYEEILPFVLTAKLIAPGVQIDDISAIFDVTQKEYNSGGVSWGSGRGHYYIHRVDREGYVKIRQKLESGRPTRSRR